MKIMVVSPHPDDESFGCGGALMRVRREQPDAEIHWVIVTDMSERTGYPAARVAERDREIGRVAELLDTTDVHRLGFDTARLDTVPLSELVGAISAVVSKTYPDTMFVPWRHDVHSDHRVVFDAATACTKTFRYPSVRRVLAYETLSETDFAMDPGVAAFRPNLFVDISADLESKLRLIACYPREIAPFPFPRNVEAVTALAKLRGAAAGVTAAEGFVLLKGIV